MEEPILENEDMIFCTLFDSNYLDRGLALIESLNQFSDSFTLYVFTFDDIAYNILMELQLKNVVVVSENEILDDELRKVKSSRTRTEYCWTCTPVIIQYMFMNYKVESCTYIDADLFFYASPKVLFDEINASACDVSIIEHRFSSFITKKANEEKHGKYCVEFNTFFNNENGKRVLEWWKQKCFSECSMKFSKEGFGDQKYLNEWPKLFKGVYELKNVGAGVAPWNLSDYKLLQNTGRSILLSYKKNVECQLIFFHFQGIKFLKQDQVFINAYSEPGKKDVKLIDYIYDEYIERLIVYRKMLYERFGFVFKEIENRKSVNRLNYSSITDFMVCIIVFINSLFYGKRNKKVIRGAEENNEG